MRTVHKFVVLRSSNPQDPKPQWDEETSAEVLGCPFQTRWGCGKGYESLSILMWAKIFSAGPSLMFMVLMRWSSLRSIKAWPSISWERNSSAISWQPGAKEKIFDWLIWPKKQQNMTIATWQRADEFINVLDVPLGGVAGQEVLREEREISTVIESFLVRKPLGSIARVGQWRNRLFVAGHVWALAGITMAWMRGVWGQQRRSHGCSSPWILWENTSETIKHISAKTNLMGHCNERERKENYPLPDIRAAVLMIGVGGFRFLWALRGWFSWEKSHSFCASNIVPEREENQ